MIENSVVNVELTALAVTTCVKAAHALATLPDRLFMTPVTNLRVDWQRSSPQPRQEQSIKSKTLLITDINYFTLL